MTVASATMRLHAMDAWVGDGDVLVDAERLRAILVEAARAGRVTVLEDAFHVFPNGAVTGVLLLAQSHLSIHTWPELAMANVDLLTYGDVDADAVLDVVRTRLGITRSTVSCLVRAGG
jgi:S-adenosylmethionine decarboxylase